MGSYLVRSRFAKTDAAEAIDTSCSPERPPYTMPIRKRFTRRHYKLASVDLSFTVTATDGRARRGRLTLPHGVIETPAFMPVGTRAAIKGLTFDQVDALDPDIILANTYHLHLRPGDPLIARAGGLHQFMGWQKPILTDSGGYQVFSLAGRRTITEEGAAFRSHIDGAAHLLTPESVVDIQARLGSDIAMVFDECAPWPADREVVEAAMERTLRWARRGRDRFQALQQGRAPDVPRATPGQAQFGIIQGGTHLDLRDRSVAGTLAVGFDAYAIGGLSVGEPVDVMYDVVAHTAAQLPEHLPRYLMGTGMPDDLIECVARGIDMFDCVLPTRLARHKTAMTMQGRLNLLNTVHISDPQPIDAACCCYTCRNFSRAYLRHLISVGEILGPVLISVHNVAMLTQLINQARQAIHEDRFSGFARDFLDQFNGAST